MSARPSGNCAEVIDAAARALLPKVMAWLKSQGDFSSDDEVLSDLKGAIRSPSHGAGDGYTIASALDQKRGWLPDFDLVEILESASSEKMEAHRRLVGEWVLRDGIKLEFGVGIRVETDRGPGVISALWSETAEYVVATDDEPRHANGGGWVLPAERCKRIAQTVE
ncbi:MAG: hypothetical protein EPN75_08735 [Beijerinckiaceae bacterium]|nr:MAG: hypothetical protein EPN75_08735 [Beijerinckiaceae bacterium]